MLMQFKINAGARDVNKIDRKVRNRRVSRKNYTGSLALIAARQSMPRSLKLK
jgi:hypothetical protein